MKRIARVAALSLVAVLALSGCLRYNVDITLGSDDTASGTVVMAVQNGIGEQLGVDSDEEAMQQLFADNPFDAESDKFSSSDYAEDDFAGKTYTFDGLDLADLAAFGDMFTVERVGDEFVVSSETAPTPEGELDQVPPGAESSLSITFPGEVTDSNGVIEGKTVTWDLFAQTEPLSATAGATSGSSFPVWLIFVALAILVVLAGIAVVVVIVVRKQKSTAPAAMSSGAEGAVPPPPPLTTEGEPPLTTEGDPAAPPAQPAPPAAPAPPEDKQE